MTPMPADVPESMRALVFHEHGEGTDVLSVEDVPTPKPARGEALVRVEATAINRLDVFVRKGWPGLDLEMPHIGGSDVAGTVAALGEGVSEEWLGKRVVVYPDLSCGACGACARGQNVLCAKHRLIGEHTRGGFAQYLAVPVENLLEIPDDFPVEEAAAASLVMVTAWRMLVTRAALKAGETVLVVGSGGGVNTAAIQIARLAGASRVFVAGGSPEKLAHAKELGATDVVNYKEDAFDKFVFKATGREGVDVVVDNVGEATWKGSVRAVKPGGRIVTVGGTTGYNPPALLNYLFWKQISVIGSTMGTPQEYRTVMDLVFKGRLHAVVDRVVPLSEGVKVFEEFERGDKFGKIVLDPRR